MRNLNYKLNKKWQQKPRNYSNKFIELKIEISKLLWINSTLLIKVNVNHSLFITVVS